MPKLENMHLHFYTFSGMGMGYESHKALLLTSPINVIHYQNILFAYFFLQTLNNIMFPVLHGISLYCLEWSICILLSSSVGVGDYLKR